MSFESIPERIRKQNEEINRLANALRNTQLPGGGEDVFVYELLDSLCWVMGGEYVETSEHPAFKKIASIFFYYLFKQDVLFVHYDEEHDLIRLYNRATEKTYFELETDYSVPKMTPGRNKDTHQVEQQPIPVTLDPDKVVQVKWRANPMRIRSLWTICREVYKLKKAFITLAYLNTKKLICQTQNADPSTIQSEIDSLLDVENPILRVRGNTENPTTGQDQIEGPALFNRFAPLEYGDLKVTEALEIIKQYLDFRLSFLGYTSEGTEKKERLTTGENYKDLKHSSNLQRVVLCSLACFSDKFAEVNPGIKLTFEINGAPNEQGLIEENGEIEPGKDEIQ